MPIYRIRRHSGHKGGTNFYYHADVIARSKKSALKAAQEGRVRNWRWIDTFDRAHETYTYYEFLYTEDAKWAKNPQRPLSIRLKRLEDRVERLNGVLAATVSLDASRARIILSIKSSELKYRVRDLLGLKINKITFEHRPAA